MNSALPPLTMDDDGVAAGEAFLADTPVLRAHVGTQPNLFLRWNRVPPATNAIDVAVHLHGFSAAGGEMALLDKVAVSGLDLSRRTRPTLALLPRGNWLGHSWYDFPALPAGGLDALVDYALERFAAALPAPAPHLAVDRLVLTAHSGGGMPAVDALAGAQRPPDELHVFDGLYGRDPRSGDPLRGIADIDAWLAARLAAEPRRPGGLRVLYIDSQTGPFSRAVGALIERRLAAFDPSARDILARRYRVERALVPHAWIARRCGPELLAAPDAAFDWSR
jgi:hypothetical protein